MTLVLQNSTGTVTGANAYLSVADFKSFHDDRGNDYSDYTDPEIAAALVKSTDYLDGRFEYVGRRYNLYQLTQWPRLDAVTPDGLTVQGIPTEVQRASALYALRVLSGTTLAPDPTPSATGGAVLSSSVKVGPIETRESYASGGSYSQPIYPEADMLLKMRGLVAQTSRTTVRA